ncbi:pentatricopeptide repeat-containing protein At4g02820, mitochondrial [Salvia miltiorrhiza]|uniref:pentatricopeptide repeat-containing protein At4g02820, mitochondrial n=1 Tax=Salvia miltiorrhiza TaxID=226208 RepID=UPI0025AC831E|nr:pentatricopeptide repeat-containing protein At4g02820, mitochondrial [Salvia miltiorrhiza]
MLRRIVRASVAATQRFSTKAAVEAAPAQETLSRQRIDGTSSRRKGGGGRDTLGRRMFALVYSKRSAVVAIRKWKEEGRAVQKYELNRIVRELRSLKRHKHALEVCEWMRTQEDMKLMSGDYAIHLDLIAKVRGLNSAEKFFVDLPENMIDPITCSALLHTYVHCKESEKAEALMKKMSENDYLKSPVPYNHMLSLYVSTEQLEKIPKIIKEVKKVTSPDIVTYNLWLAACASQDAVETARKVFRELSEAKIEPDWVTHSTMASMYIKNSFREEAESALKDMEKKASRKVRVAYASLISLHTALGNKNDIRGIWKKMKATFRKLNDVEYTCMITSLLKLKEFQEAEKLYDEWESVSPTKDSRVPNLLLAAYINNEQMHKAETFYTRMVESKIVPGYTTWELLTWGYLKQRQVDKVVDCFKKAIRSVRQWDPDEKLVQAVLALVEEFGDVEVAENMLSTLGRVGYVNTEIYNSLLRTYANAGKMALIVAERMKKDNVEMDEETKRLVQLTSKMCVTEIPTDA